MVKVSERELEILQYLAYNPDYRECAKYLCIEYSTVKTHVASIFKKYKVNNLAKLIVKYYTELQFNFIEKSCKNHKLW